MNRKSKIAFLLMLAGSVISGFSGPWWAPAVFILLLTALMKLPAKISAIGGMSAMGISYLFMALYMDAQDNAGIIEKTGLLLGGISPLLMLLITTLTGVITGLLSGWLGSSLGASFSPAK